MKIMTDFNKNIKNFGLIKSIFNNTLAESVITKDDNKKELFKNYVKTIKENEILRTQFLVYTNIEEKVEADATKASMFVKENIDLFSKFNKKDILEANTKLVNLEKSLFETENADDTNKLYESISTLIFTNRTPETIDTIVEAMAMVIGHIVNNKPKVVNEAIDLPNSMVTTIMVDKYNEKYSTLDESEKRVLKSLIESNDEEKAEVYSSVLSECLELINEKLNTDDLDVKDKLLRVKERLLNDKKEINEDFEKNISKLVELRATLKQN